MGQMDDLVAKLRLDISDYEKNAKKAEKATDSLEKETKQLEEPNESTGDSFDKLMTAFTGLNQGIQLVQQVFQTLKKGYDAVITSTLTYAEEVRSLSRTIGASAEDSSKLIQAADDVKVSYEDLTNGMNIAIKNGLEPTIAGMGRLADEYVALNDPIAQTKFLLDNFGRSGANLAPMMELGAAGIKALGDEAESTGLVLDTKAVKAARRLEIQMDRADDAMAGLSVTIANELIPSITDLLEKYNDAVDTLGSGLKGANDFEDQRNEILATSSSFEDYTKKVDELYNSQNDNTKATIDYFEQVNYGIMMTAAGISESKTLVDEATAGMADGYYNLSEGAYDAMRAQAEQSRNMEVQQGIIDTYEQHQKDLAVTVSNLKDKYLEQVKVLSEDLVNAYAEAQKAEENWRGGAAGKIRSEYVKQAEEEGRSIDEIISGLEVLDSWAGTQFGYELRIEQEIPDLVEKLLNDPDSFVTAAQAFEDYFMPLDNSIAAAELKIDGLKTKLESLERTYKAVISVTTTNPWTGYMGDAYENYSGPHAGGGTVSGGSHITWGEYGPEPFIPAQDGRILSHADAMNAVGRSGSSDLNTDLLQTLVSQMDSLPSAMKIALQEAIVLQNG